MDDTLELLNSFIKKEFKDGLFTAIPGKVIKVDKFGTKQTVDVKPCIGRIYSDGVSEKLPVLYNVPVVMLGGGGALFSVPIAINDNVLLIFSMRDIDRWKTGDGSEIFPDTHRMHNLNDAVAIPGLFTEQNVLSPGTEDVVISFSGSEIRLKSTGDIQVNGGPSGKIAVGNSSEELLALIEELLIGLENATTSTMLGPQPLINAATFTDIKTRLATIKGTL